MAISDYGDVHPDFGTIPQSKGVPNIVFVAAVIGAIVIFMIGGAVILNSGFGRDWPSMSTTRIPLGSMPSL